MKDLLLPLTLLAVVGLGIACPSKCSCTEDTMQCIERGLTSVPTGIPRSIEKIELQGNNISHITRSDFAGLRKLRILYLDENQIVSIEKNSFGENNLLEILRLNNNELTILPENLFSKLRALQRLDLSHNRIGIIQKKTFRGPNSLRTLQLSNNEISCLHESSLRPVRSVEFLTLDNNKLTTLPLQSFEHLMKLRTFRFNNNPLNCDCHLAWISEWLISRPSAGLFTQCAEPSHLQGMEIKHLERGEFVCDASTGRQKPKCEMSSYCPSMCKCSNGIVDCRDKGLKSLPVSMPADVTEIRLEQNMIEVIPARAFARYRKLKRIDLSNNLISEVSEDSFQGLKHLNSLIMYENKITSLPKGIFAGLGNLQLLLLNANKLSCLRHDTFDGLVSLKLLSLYDNKLQIISKGTFRSLKSIQTLHLAQNPFICDCNLRWLADYLQDNPVETSGARCAAPRRLGNKKIAHVKSRRFKCEEGDNFPPPFAGECSPEAECPDKCRCDGSVIDCSRQQLTGVPDNIPPYATELNLAFNDIEILASLDIFKKLTNLKKIDLSNNKLMIIEEGAFNGAYSVLELWINDNELSDMNGGMFTGLRNLRTLMARNNRLKCISNATFAGLSSMTHLSLYGNQITSIVEGAFDSLTSLNLLNLLSNPLICNCHMSWLSVWLRTGTFSSGNPRCAEPSFLHGFPVADINPQDFHCSTEEKSQPPTCKPEVKCPERCLCEGTVVRCINVGLTAVPVDDIPETVTELYLNLNKIRLIPTSIKRFTKLEKLDLSNNLIATLQDNIFANFTRLSTLLLAYNKLRCLPPRGFSGLKNLRILSLHSNEISTVQHGTFDDLIALSHAGFGSNPWYCDCNLAWFNEWINKDYLEPGIAQCSGPSAVAGRVLLTTPIASFVCNDLPLSKCKRRKSRRRGPLSIPIASKCDPCLSTPCLHDGTCRLHPVEYYQCICPSGFKGKHCEMPVNACNLHPCRNGATCTGRDEISYTCTCPPGFSGYDCEINIDDCKMRPCRPDNATCIDGINTYTCKCPPGWSGDFCHIEIEDPCSENPCMNEGQCFPSLASDGQVEFRCECKIGFRGLNCSEEWDPCLDHKCENEAQCVMDGSNGAGYRCECSRGYRGQYCEFIDGHTALIQQDDPCIGNDCENGAQCYVEPGRASDFTCRCLPGYTGNKCQMLTGVSFLRNGSYAELHKAVEDQEYLQITVEIATKELNGVILYAGESSQHITIELFAGHVRFSYDGINSAIYSEEIINDEEFHVIRLDIRTASVTMVIDDSRNYEAVSKKIVSTALPLYVGGIPANVLSNARRSWHIRNTTSFVGCLRNLNIDGEPVDFFTASQAGFSDLFQQDTGVRPGCSRDGLVSTCSDLTCKFGECVANENGGSQCSCMEGYSGIYCDIEDSEPTACSGNRCQHGMCVVNGENASSYVCECDAGYGGEFCEIRDFCAGVDCGDHGTCVPHSSGHTCKCRMGYSGRNCASRIRRCSGTKTRQFVQITVARSSSDESPTTSSDMTLSSSDTMLCKSNKRITNLVCDSSSCTRISRRTARRRARGSESGHFRATTLRGLGAILNEEPPAPTCCAPLRQKRKNIELLCEDGTRITQQVTKVQSCGCQTCGQE
ncbi:slit homolog 1 protein-like isoform X2 [Styela clava]